MNEGGGDYRSKKTDDTCGDVCGQVLYYFDLFLFFLCCNFWVLIFHGNVREVNGVQNFWILG